MGQNINYIIKKDFKSILLYCYMTEHYLRVHHNINVNWWYLSMNPNAESILKQNQDKVDWLYLTKNRNPNIISIFEQNMDKVTWINLSSNPSAIHIIEKNLDKVNWWNLCQNPAAIHILEQN